MSLFLDLPGGFHNQVAGPQQQIGACETQGRQGRSRRKPIPKPAGKLPSPNPKAADQASQDKALGQGGRQASQPESQVPGEFSPGLFAKVEGDPPKA